MRSRPSPRVLHVEDDPYNRRIVRDLLGDVADVSVAGSLKDARQALAQQRFDLILLDLALPDGGGETLLGDVGDIPVVIFSAKEAPRALASQVAQALVKSRVSEEELRRVIADLLA